MRALTVRHKITFRPPQLTKTGKPMQRGKSIQFEFLVILSHACVCVCVYVYVYIYTYTYTPSLWHLGERQSNSRGGMGQIDLPTLHYICIRWSTIMVYHRITSFLVLFQQRQITHYIVTFKWSNFKELSPSWKLLWLHYWSILFLITKCSIVPT